MTEKASDKVKDLMAQQDTPVLLRVYMAASGGGFKYGMAFDEHADPEEDIELEQNGVKIVVDKESANYLDGTEIDYVETLEGGGFTLNNPNLKVTNGQGCSCGGGGCGCGCGA
ncbi:MAG: iron-sulfur cluster assembly accessory protein [Methanomassiliicoccales archaeon]